MYFSSDNWAGAHPKIVESLTRHSGGFEPAYGNGTLDKKVGKKFSEIFEREVEVFFVGTGTAANSLALTLFNRPGGLSFCHREAHVLTDECGAPEYLSGGSRLHPVDGPLGRISPESLDRAVGRFVPTDVDSGRPMAITFTQATEVGTVYSLDDTAAISGIAQKYGLPLHMDGARFANALVSLNTTPAEMTWKRGVDILSFGGTKNGCWCAEAIVLFDRSRSEELAFIRKRAAQLFSKSRFIAAQFDAYFDGDLWLETARHANKLGARLADHIRTSRSNRVRLAWEPQANEVFAVIPKAEQERLRGRGLAFAAWNTPNGFGEELADDESICRFVTSFATTEADVSRFADLIEA